MTPKDEVEFACKFLGAEIRKPPYDNGPYFRIYYEGSGYDFYKSTIAGKWHVTVEGSCYAHPSLVGAILAHSKPEG